MVQPRTPRNPPLPDYSFRCPSCLGVLSVNRKMAGTSAPCPLCAAPIIAPQPLPHGIPFALLEGSETAPSAAPQGPKPAEKSRSQGKIILVDGGINQGGMNSKSSPVSSQTILFVILAVLFLLVGIWLVAGL